MLSFPVSHKVRYSYLNLYSSAQDGILNLDLVSMWFFVQNCKLYIASENSEMMWRISHSICLDVSGSIDASTSDFLSGSH
jgi:hypothetical protein